MTDEHADAASFRTHLLLAGAVAGLLLVVAAFLGRHPMECPKGFAPVSTWTTQWCAMDLAKQP